MGSYGILGDIEKRRLKRIEKTIAIGARGVMRGYARIKEVSIGTARELRQTSITMAVKNMGKIVNKKKEKI